MPYQYAYFFAVGLLGLVWLIFFLLRKDLRGQQLFVSLFSAPLGITQILWFYKDYWRPEYIYTFYVRGVPIGPEDILFSFFIGGVGSILYEVLFHKRYRPGRNRPFATVAVIIFSAVLFLFLKSQDINTVWASAAAFLAGSLVMISADRDLRADWTMSSICMFFFIISIYMLWLFFFPAIVRTLWVSASLSGHELLGVPVEEIAWFVCWAMFSGIAYEFMVNAGKYSNVSKKPFRKGVRI